MAIATGTALLAGAALTAGSAIYSSSQAKKAASLSAAGADTAAQLQYQASIESAEMMANAQKEAARLQAEAQDRATGELRRQYDETGQVLKPWVTAGTKALGTLQEKVQAGPGAFTASPGYQFRLGEGMRAIEQSAAARGKQLSGQTMMGLQEYGQGMATMEYDKFLNQYYQSLTPFESLSSAGLNAAARTGQAGQAMASNIAQIETGTANAIAQGLLQSASAQGSYMTSGAAGAGNALQNAATARASGYINSANALMGAGNTIGQGALLYSLLNK